MIKRQEKNSKKSNHFKKNQENNNIVNKDKDLSGSSSLEKITILNKQISIRLKKRRKQMGISQTDLANLLGLSFQQIQKYERGSTRLSCGLIFEIAKLLHIRIGYFFDGLDEENAENDSDLELLRAGTNNTFGEDELGETDFNDDPIIEKIRELEKDFWRLKMENKIKR